MLDGSTYVYYVAIDPFHVVSREERLREVGRVAERFGFAYDWHREGVVNRLVMQDLIPLFEDLIRRLQPEEVFVPDARAYNQDHRAVEAMARTRGEQAGVRHAEGFEVLRWVA